jgi:hypothetical protein
MCVYIYSPGKAIQLDYVIEQIFLQKKGVAEILLDILITNKSTESIGKVFVLFPHKLFKLSVHKKKLNKKALGECEDITDSYLQKESVYNTIYKLPDSSILPVPEGDKFNLNIKIPNPNDPVEDITYNGEIIGTSTLKNLALGNLIQEKILSDLDLSLMVGEFDTPLVKDAARWVRWRLKSDCFSKDQMSGFSYSFKLLYDEIKLRYEIIGPLDVRTRFAKKLGCYLKICAINPNISKDKLATNTSQLLQKFSEQGFNGKNTVTKFPDWRIMLFPNNFEELDNIIKEGDLQICGTSPSPNYIEQFTIDNLKETKSKYFRGNSFYYWKSGSRNIEIMRDGVFSIGFIAKHMSTFRKIVPILAFLLSVISFTVMILINFILH